MGLQDLHCGVSCSTHSIAVIWQLQSIFCERGAPEEILPDNDTAFRSEETRKFLENLGPLTAHREMSSLKETTELSREWQSDQIFPYRRLFIGTTSQLTKREQVR